MFRFGNLGDLLSGVQHNTSDRLLVVCQSRSGFSSNQIPQSDGWIVTACKKLISCSCYLTLTVKRPTNRLQGQPLNGDTQGFVWYLPVMICGSAAWHLTVATVLVWPVSVCTFAFVLMSHTCMDREKNPITLINESCRGLNYTHQIQNICNSCLM